MIDGRWCYFTTENQAAARWFVVDGTKYYSYTKAEYDDNGIFQKYSIGIATGYKYIDEKLYNFASGGACLGEVTTDGWYYVEDDWYYVQNGKLVREDVVSIGGVKYAFSHGGWMLTDAIAYDSDTGRHILLGKNGAQITGGWYLLETEYSSEWYYVDSQGYLLTGTHIIDGVSYYFDV
jgi:lactocepin